MATVDCTACGCEAVVYGLGQSLREITMAYVSNALRLAPITCACASLLICRQTLAAPSNTECNTRVNDTLPKLLECIQQQPLYEHLVDFQHISDANPSPDGHGNRNTGTSGYKASVDYVAGLMRAAGYKVTIQPYHWMDFQLTGVPTFANAKRTYAMSSDWYVARLSGQGDVDAPVQPVGRIMVDGGATGSTSACSANDFAGFRRGNVALVQRGGCELDVKVRNAQAAGAAGVIMFNTADIGIRDNDRGMPKTGVAYPARLTEAANIPVVGAASYDVGAELYRDYQAGTTPKARISVHAKTNPGAIDYNLIADSPFGDPSRVVVVEGHLDAIYGAGILDNASGSATILEVALKLAHTPTVNQLRYIWFGGEELGLLGSKYYTGNLTPSELQNIAYDIDSDVTATPNYAVEIADPQGAGNVAKFPPNVVPQSRRGDNYFLGYFRSVGIPAILAPAGNDGTDSNSFSLVGVPNTGIFTQQDCCKGDFSVKKWGGFLGNYEGKVPGYNGGCVDYPGRWCDNIDNTLPFVLEFTSKAFAYVTFKLANDANLPSRAHQ